MRIGVQCEQALRLAELHEPGFSTECPTPLLGFSTLGEQHTHENHAHTCSKPQSTLVRAHTHTARYGSTHLDMVHTFLYRLTEIVMLLQMQVTSPNLKWQPLVASIKSQCKRCLLIGTLCKKWRHKCTTLAYMHHDGEKSQPIRSFITMLGILKKKNKKKKEEWNTWAAISRTQLPMWFRWS